MPEPSLGPPLTGPYPIPGGEARLFVRGVTVNSQGSQVSASFAFPMIGRPSIVTGAPPLGPVFEAGAIHFFGNAGNAETRASLLGSALSGRLVLLPTGPAAPVTALTIGPPVETASNTYGLPLAVPALQDRHLYDVAALVDGGTYRLAPHALYYRRSWTDFGLAHITDMHVARRIDRFRGLLNQAGRSAAAQRLYNWNDRFRGFVRYANYLHGLGLLDVIMATGDLYDYILEDDDDPAGGGNPAFLRRLILGQAPGPEFPDVEELRVPIFLAPGNHDYRKHSYKLIFDVSLDLGAAEFELKRIPNHSGFNLTAPEAAALQSQLDGHGLFPFVQNLSADEAARMVEVDRDMPAYKASLGEPGPYTVRLGAHSLVMLDSAHDVGIVTSLLDVVKVKLGFGSEDEATFVGGDPNCEGISSDDRVCALKALAETPDEGLLILGVHAPLFNVHGSVYPYFLRESQRPAQSGQDVAFLAASEPGLVLEDPTPDEISSFVKERHPLWFGPAPEHSTPTFIKRGNSEDRLDFGVSGGHSDELTSLLAGVGARRPADVVLAGHTHRYNEFRVGPLATGELAFFMDFYTANPVNYYPTRFATEPPRYKTTKVTYVEVATGAAPDAPPARLPYNARHDYHVQVPPYPEPLAAATDARAWWANHRPLFLQTGALGPLDNSQVSFSGFRVLSVRDNVIARVDFLPIARLEANDYRLPWDEAIRPEPRLSPGARSWRSVSEGRTVPGAAVAAVATATGSQKRTSVLVADANGGIYGTSSPGGDWAPWRTISEGRTVPGGPVTVVALGDRIVAFLADPAGGIYAASGRATGDWGPWRSVSEGGSRPGAHIAAAAIGSNRITLVIANVDGEVFATSGNPESGVWEPWGSVSQGATVPGGPITAVVNDGAVTCLLTDVNGGVYATSGSTAAGWKPWKPVSEGRSTPGGSVGAMAMGDGRLALFLADPSGGVYTTSGSVKAGWGPWTSVSEGRTTPGGWVTPVATGDTIRLFLSDTAGEIYAASGRERSWGPWSSVAEGSSSPGARLSAVASAQNSVDLFTVDLLGGIYHNHVKFAQ